MLNPPPLPARLRTARGLETHAQAATQGLSFIAFPDSVKVTTQTQEKRLEVVWGVGVYHSSINSRDEHKQSTTNKSEAQKVGSDHRGTGEAYSSIPQL